MKKLTVLFLILVFASGAGAGEKIVWLTTISDALQIADQNSKPILVDVYTEWCGWCTKLDEEVYTNAEFIRYMDSFVGLKLNAEDEGIGSKVAEQFRVEGFPTILVFDKTGKLLGKVEGYLEAKEMIQEVNKILESGEPRLSAEMNRS
jgi:thioredoxin-related protein